MVGDWEDSCQPLDLRGRVSVWTIPMLCGLLFMSVNALYEVDASWLRSQFLRLSFGSDMRSWSGILNSEVLGLSSRSYNASIVVVWLCFVLLFVCYFIVCGVLDVISYLPTIKIVVNQSCYEFSCPNFTCVTHLWEIYFWALIITCWSYHDCWLVPNFLLTEASCKRFLPSN